MPAKKNKQAKKIAVVKLTRTCDVVTVSLSEFMEQAGKYVARSISGVQIKVVGPQNNLIAVFGRGDPQTDKLSEEDEEDATDSPRPDSTDRLSWVG